MPRRTRVQRAAAILAAFMACGVAHSQMSLSELGAANAARNQMMGDSAQATAGAQPAAAAPAVSPAKAATSIGFGGMKYTLSYALMLMFVGLGVYLVCRPAHRHDAE